MEDKGKICDLLLPVLQATRNLHDLMDLEYIREEEKVYATFADGTVEKVDVVTCSGIEMILNILKKIS